jgi:hypothetical protein
MVNGSCNNSNNIHKEAVYMCLYAMKKKKREKKGYKRKLNMSEAEF